MLGNTFHHSAFDAADLVRAKRALDLSVSVCLPARDEEATVGDIVTAVRRDLLEMVPLVDEIIVVDDGSIDETVALAEAAGATVVRASSVLTDFGPSQGKGDALWRSLHSSRGDLICWLDADLTSFESHFVTGLLGPLLTDAGTGLVKAYYERPAGGRVTELMARPVISALFPRLAPVVQPLGGEYAGRRTILERLPFPTGWGVEVGLLVEVLERFGARSIAQVDLGVRHHRTRSIDDLSPQALAILVTSLRKAGLQGEASDELLRARPGAAGGVGRVERIPVATGERPPIIEVAEYRSRRRAAKDTA